MKVHFLFKDVPPYMVKMIEGDFLYNTYDAHHKALNFMRKVKGDRNIWGKLTEEQKKLFEDLWAKIWNGEPIIVKYKISWDEHVNGIDVHVVLEFPQEFYDFYKAVRKLLPWGYRSALDILLDPKTLIKKMVKEGKKIYGVEIVGWEEPENSGENP